MHAARQPVPEIERLAGRGRLRTRCSAGCANMIHAPRPTIRSAGTDAPRHRRAHPRAVTSSIICAEDLCPPDPGTTLRPWHDPPWHCDAAGRPALGGVFFGLFLAAAGGVFVWLLGRAGLRARAMESWPRVPCTILESRVSPEPVVPNTPLNYRPVVRYRLRSRWSVPRVRPHPPGCAEVERGGEDANDRRSISPRDPPLCAILIRTIRRSACSSATEHTPLYSIWFPALFVIGGLGHCRQFSGAQPEAITPRPPMKHLVPSFALALVSNLASRRRRRASSTTWSSTAAPRPASSPPCRLRA